ncbi:MAG: molybdopterin-dependent oxidoreductase [Flavobacteriaceae bacterium]|nr:molybdopterin-dependent oxidoreductase [Flavobacteriaceae bacterium]
MKNRDSYSHLRGESLYIDDLNTQQGTLYGLVCDAQIAHAKILDLDIVKAEALAGVVKIFTHSDVPGKNQIGGIIPDEPLLAETDIHFWGQPIAFIVAKSEAIAKKARALINIKTEALPVITTAIEAFEKGEFVCAPRTFKLGDTSKAFKNCDYIIKGNTFSNGQEHLYLETQGAYAEYHENGKIKVTSSTQGPTQVQKAVAKVLGVGMHQVEVDVIRLGGGFGGKEDQATAWAVMAALAAKTLHKPVKYVLNRHDDLRMTGKRHPYDSSFKIGLNKDLKIQAFEATFLQNSGAAADLSPAIAERTLFHATNAYNIKNVNTTVHSCKTNLPPNTAFRGFGGPQGMFVIESAIAKVAEKLNIPAFKIQEANLLQDNDVFSYGQIAMQVEAKNTWQSAINSFNFESNFKAVKKFNSKNNGVKKGISIMPICFGISFTNTPMNHARALVHIYQDGSVGFSTGAVEMGQGVNTKLQQIVMYTFGLAKEKIHIESTNTTRVANTSPSAASATADLNGKALLKACKALKERLFNVASKNLNIPDSELSFKDGKVCQNSKPTHLSWEVLIETAFLERVSLSEKAHHTTPKIYFDKSKEKGHPFAYHVYGTAISTVAVDCIRGTYEIESVKIVHDFGKSMNLNIDMGQVEGALAQGIGWMTMEEIAYDKNGRLLSNALSTYKIPDIYAMPKIIEVKVLESDGHKMALLKSKAVGEPPLMYGIGTYFAIQNAIKAFNNNYELKFDAPLTPEKVLKSLYSNAFKL